MSAYQPHHIQAAKEAAAIQAYLDTIKIGTQDQKRYPYSSPTKQGPEPKNNVKNTYGGAQKVHIGPRGGRYVYKKNKKVYNSSI